MDEEIQYLGTNRANVISLDCDAQRPVLGISLVTVNEETEERVADTFPKPFYKSLATTIDIGRSTTSDGDTGDAASGGVVRAAFTCPVMSRRHAQISFLDDGSVSITDIGSHHGTYIRKPHFAKSIPQRIEALKPHSLHDGNLLTLGKAVLKDDQLYNPVTVRVNFLYTPGPKLATPPPPDNDPIRSKSNTPNRYGCYSPSSSSSSSDASDSDSIEEVSLNTSPSMSGEMCKWTPFQFSRFTGFENTATLPSLRRLGLLSDEQAEGQSNLIPGVPSTEGNISVSGSSEVDFYHDSMPSLPRNQLGMPLGAHYTESYIGHIDSEDIEDTRSQSSSQMQISSGSVSPEASRSPTPEPVVVGAWPKSPVIPEPHVLFAVLENYRRQSNPNASNIERESGRSQLVDNDVSIPSGSAQTTDASSSPWRLPNGAAFINETSRHEDENTNSKEIPTAPESSGFWGLSAASNPWVPSVPPSMEVTERFGQNENCGSEDMSASQPQLHPGAGAASTCEAGAHDSVSHQCDHHEVLMPYVRTIVDPPSDMNRSVVQAALAENLRRLASEFGLAHDNQRFEDRFDCMRQLYVTQSHQVNNLIQDELTGVKESLGELKGSIKRLSDEYISTEAQRTAVTQPSPDVVSREDMKVLLDEIKGFHASIGDQLRLDMKTRDQALQLTSCSTPSTTSNNRKRPRSDDVDDSEVVNSRAKRVRLGTGSIVAGAMSVGAIAAWTALAFC